MERTSDACLPKRSLGFREFAEKYVKLPKTSPFGNVPFRCYRQPYAGVLFDEMDSQRWKTILISGPSQSGKTLSSFVIPILRDIKELGYNTIAAFPEADMASDKWDTDFMPTLRDSPDLDYLIPTTGPGSKKGRIRDRITLGNGVDIKIMTCGGQDTGKAGYTSPRVYVTEAAGWSHSGETSVESNPLRQLRARLKAFKRVDPRRCLVVEGTLTVEEELPWSARGEDDDEKLVSSRSRLVSPCPHCGEFVSPARKDLVGWQKADTEDEAANEARWLCPSCEKPIDNDQRQESMKSLRLVHWGQRVNEEGEVVGTAPPTSTLWFHWQGWHNLLRDIGDFGAAEWEADQVEEGTEEYDNAQRELAQFDFSHPYRSTLGDTDPLKASTIRKRTETWPRNVLPPDTKKLTIGVDIGKWTSWWVALAWRECGRVHIPAYGAFSVCHSANDDLRVRLMEALSEFAESVCEVGFPMEGSDGMHLPEKVFIDIGYLPDEVSDFIRSQGTFRRNRYIGARGRGKSAKKFPGSQQASSYAHPKKISSSRFRIGNNWFLEPNFDRKTPEITFNSDYWKLYVDARFRGDKETVGALTLFRADLKNEHAKFSNHIANEQFQRVWEPGKGLVDKWVLTGDNHYKDSMAMACAAGDFVGYRYQEPEESEGPEQAGEDGGNFYENMGAR